ncbi:MAG: hypothetical protein HF977_15795 [ANME-2 cluster archaeon]|nr:hypothetical protein [ANME-2 cluster archaeon]
MRVFLVLLLLVLISGCITSEPDEETLIEEDINMDAISITSDVFKNGSMLSSEYTCDGSDVSPDLSRDTSPPAAANYTLRYPKTRTWTTAACMARMTLAGSAITDHARCRV